MFEVTNCDKRNYFKNVLLIANFQTTQKKFGSVVSFAFQLEAIRYWNFSKLTRNIPFPKKWDDGLRSYVTKGP